MSFDNNLKEEAKLKKSSFYRINSKFRQYWSVLFWLIFIYIISYLVWSNFLVPQVGIFLEKKGLGKNDWSLVLFVAIVQGLLFSLDGFVTSLLKSPFQQMCYALNMAKEIDNRDKDYIVTKATESNEHCKETLKKFGILTISAEILKVFIKGSNKEEMGKYAYLLNIAYLIPLVWAGIDIILINKRLGKTKKKIISRSSKKFS